MSAYSQCMDADRSIHCFCASSWVDASSSFHHANDARPGWIQLVSAIWLGALTSVTSVDSTIVFGESPAMTTRQGVCQGRVETGSTWPVPRPSSASGNLTLYVPDSTVAASRVPQ